MSAFPLRYVHQNILVGRGDARAALFRVDTVSYPFLAAADKREWLRRLARFAFAVEADFSLWRVCRAYPAERYAEQAHGLLDPRGQDPEAWRAFLDGHQAHLREPALLPPRGLPRRLARPGAAGGPDAPAGRRAPARRGDVRRGGPAADRRDGDRGADRRRGARLPARRGLPARAPRDDPRAAVAAAAGGVPRRRRARARRPLGAERARRRDGLRRAGLRAARHRPRAPRERAGPRAGSLARRRRRGGPLPPGAARARRAAGGVGVPGRRRAAVLPARGRRVPRRRRGARALAGQPRRDHPRAAADRRRRRRLLRAARLHARPAVVRGRGEPPARPRAGRLPAVPRAPAAAQRGHLARGRRRLRPGARAPRRGPARSATGRSRCTGRSASSRRSSSITCRAPTAASCATTRTC